MRVEVKYGREEPPLYVQIANALQAFIEAEELNPGDLLPSEKVLAQENRLSRSTIIKAFDILVDRGLVKRQQGKGTFVRERPMERQLPELTGFSEHVYGLGLTPGSSLLSFEVISSDAPSQPASGFETEHELVAQSLVRVERLRTVGDQPVGIHLTLVPVEIAEQIGLTELAASHPNFSLYDALRVGGVFLDSGEESLRAINAETNDAELLGVDLGAALIEVIRTSRDASGHLVEVVRARYLGTQYRYHIKFAPTTIGGNHEQTPRSDRSSGGGLAAAQRMFGAD